MMNLIRADIYRILRGKGIYVCLVLIGLLISLTVGLKSAFNAGLNTNFDQLDTIDMTEQPESLEDVMDLLGSNQEHPVDGDIMQSGGSLYYFFIFIVFVVICTDLSNHTAKNIISSGISRGTYYMAKLLLSLGMGTFFILVTTYVGYIVNLLVNGSAYSSSLGDITMVLIRQLPVFYGMIGILVMLSVYLQKTAKYNGVTILLVMGTQMFIMILSAIFSFNAADVLQYEFEGLIKGMVVMGSMDLQPLLIGVGAGIGTLAITTVLGMQYFKKVTIK